MVMLNDLDRFHLVIDVIDRVPGLAAQRRRTCARRWSTPGRRAGDYTRRVRRGRPPGRRVALGSATPIPHQRLKRGRVRVRGDSWSATTAPPTPRSPWTGRWKRRGRSGGSRCGWLRLRVADRAPAGSGPGMAPGGLAGRAPPAGRSRTWSQGRRGRRRRAPRRAGPRRGVRRPARPGAAGTLGRGRPAGARQPGPRRFRRPAGRAPPHRPSAAHAHCPVVVVRGEAGPATPNRRRRRRRGRLGALAAGARTSRPTGRRSGRFRCGCCGPGRRRPRAGARRSSTRTKIAAQERAAAEESVAPWRRDAPRAGGHHRDRHRQPGGGAGRGEPGGAAGGGRQPRPRRPARDAARLGQPAADPARPLPGRGRPELHQEQ